MIQILENWKASRHHAREQAAERRALEQRRDKLATRQMALECQLIETQTRMATEQANPLWGDPQFRRGFKSMLQSEPDFPGRTKLMEGLDYFDTIVDPFDAVRGDNGELWDQIASAMYGASEPFLGLLGFRNELELRMARNLSRLLCKENPWAICGIKNRINYTIGTGHTYQIVAKKGQEIDPTIIAAIQRVLDAWTERNKWSAIQKDCFFREDMDGECILKLFETSEGLQVRFVEPWQLTTPAAAMDPAHAWGVQVDLEDSQNVIAYWIDSKPVDPEQIQHRKRNVMRNVRRGIPTFYPCRFHLRRAENLLKNMGLVAELQASIAIIRKWPSGATGAQMGAFQASASQAQYTSATTSERRSFEKFRPGTILDVKAGYDYDYPGAGIDASNYGEVLACELRAVSSRLVMPEWMLSSDASNANYASTMVSEGSCVKEFEALSGDQEAHDLEILWRVLRFAGRKINSPFPVEVLDGVDIQVGTPNIIARDRLQEVQADQLLQTAGVLSPQTMADRNDLDYQQEMSNIEDHCDRFGGRPATLAGVMPIEPHGPLGDDGTPPMPVWNPGAASDDRPLSPNGPMDASDYQTGGIPKDLVMGENPPIDTGPRARKGLPTERTDDLAFFALNAQGALPASEPGSIREGSDDQPRVPAGQSGGGEFGTTGNGSSRKSKSKGGAQKAPAQPSDGDSGQTISVKPDSKSHDAKFDAEINKFKAGLSKADTDALGSWQAHGGYKKIREGELSGHPDAALDAALAKAPVFNGTAYRGMNIKAFKDIAGMSGPGGTMTINATSSASPDIGTAHTFAKMGKGESCLMVMKTKSSRMYNGDYAREVLMTRGQKYNISGVHHDVTVNIGKTPVHYDHVIEMSES